MKYLSLVVVFGLSACVSTNLFQETPSKDVVIDGRTWKVSSNANKAGSYVARRDNNNLNPFGGPAALLTPQAVRALELATGCKAVRSSIWQTPSAEFYADMACPGQASVPG